MRVPCVVVAVLAAVLVSCEQPTVDPDQAVRDRIVGPTWVSDPAYQPPATTVDPAEFYVIFHSNGKALMDSGGRIATWSYRNKVFTLKYVESNQTGGTQVVETTRVPVFLVTSKRLQFNYQGGVCHLILMSN